MNKKIIWTFACFCVAMIGFFCGFYLYKSDSHRKYDNYIHPYREYSSVLLCGDTVLYNNIVKERRIKTPSHPDYFDLSIKMAGKFGYTPAYYNAYLALHDLYEYNHFKMGDDVKRLMYSYLQLAIENKDCRITENDILNYQKEFPNGIALIPSKQSDKE